MHRRVVKLLDGALEECRASGRMAGKGGRNGEEEGREGDRSRMEKKGEEGVNRE